MSTVQNAEELFEVGKGRFSHPDDEVVVDEAVVVGIGRVEVIHRSLPVQRISRT